jgi:hypothetical protein
MGLSVAITAKAFCYVARLGIIYTKNNLKDRKIKTCDF